ncbi:hypothetical protein M8C21_018001 [Ambrosia artemisiifolia]|uniref:Ubiquitin carboxyl-terminal hydrolase 14 n=1 Tax=Ambrosia artemisiifolia TaxID=4212 RepID=A0AAD5CTB5_AMBAR|nr:hypothetical protein M8C21_018001 [Ambrosia artemisiifolia]
MRKFVMETGWVPKKLDVYTDVDDIIDITHMRSKGLQPGEDLLPEDASGIEEESKVLPNDDIVSQLASMGFNRLHCQKAAINTSYAGVEEAMNWLLSHMDDPDIDAPIPKLTKINDAEPSKVATLVSFGFEEEIARKALKASGGDIEEATDWIFNPNAASGPSNMDATSSSGPSMDATLPDGDGKYRLIGLVSHMGKSIQCGHYVAHVYKERRWVIFNDDKVGVSKDPPKDMAYLYFYERIQS